jgi:hypothetical protein
MSIIGDKLEKMCRDHFNELMISFGELARCIGYGEDESDCYIITRRRDGSIVWNTCVGGYVWLDRLKGQGYVKSSNGEDWDDLTRLELEMPLAPKEAEFICQRRSPEQEELINHTDQIHKG